VLRCPESADEINFGDSSQTGTTQDFGSDAALQDVFWSAGPDADWAVLTDITDPLWRHDFMNDLPFGTW
jgi:hypothetical protein